MASFTLFAKVGPKPTLANHPNKLSHENMNQYRFQINISEIKTFTKVYKNRKWYCNANTDLEAIGKVEEKLNNHLPVLSFKISCAKNIGKATIHDLGD